MREALAASLNSRNEFVLVGSTGSVDGLWGLCGLQWPDAVLADVGAREADVAILVSRFRSAFPWVRLVLMYTQLPQSVMVDAVRDAAVTFVHQSAGIEQLVAALSTDGMDLSVDSEADPPHRREVKRGDLPVVAATEPYLPQGLPSLALVHGSAGDSMRQVVAALEAAGVPFAVSSRVANGGAADGAATAEAAEYSGRRKGPVVALVLDPTEEDWRKISGLRAPIAVVYSAPPGPEARLDAFSRGAKAMLSVADFVRALPLVATGCVVASPVFARDLVLSNTQRNAGPATQVPGLTGRERQILNSVKAGDTVKQTAKALGIAVKTVENTQGRLFCKLGVRNRSEALSQAYRLGLLDPH